MTPEDRAKAVLAKFWCPPHLIWGPGHVEDIAAAIRAAVAEEREACANMADEYGAGTEDDVVAISVGDFYAKYGPHRTLGEAIRARGNA